MRNFEEVLFLVSWGFLLKARLLGIWSLLFLLFSFLSCVRQPKKKSKVGNFNCFFGFNPSSCPASDDTLGFVWSRPQFLLFPWTERRNLGHGCAFLVLPVGSFASHYVSSSVFGANVWSLHGCRTRLELFDFEISDSFQSSTYFFSILD